MVINISKKYFYREDVSDIRVSKYFERVCWRRTQTVLIRHPWLSSTFPRHRVGELLCVEQNIKIPGCLNINPCSYIFYGVVSAHKSCYFCAHIPSPVPVHCRTEPQSLYGKLTIFHHLKESPIKIHEKKVEKNKRKSQPHTEILK